jgi:hypothetical protein
MFIQDTSYIATASRRNIMVQKCDIQSTEPNKVESEEAVAQSTSQWSASIDVSEPSTPSDSPECEQSSVRHEKRSASSELDENNDHASNKTRGESASLEELSEEELEPEPRSVEAIRMLQQAEVKEYQSERFNPCRQYIMTDERPDNIKTPQTGAPLKETSDLDKCSKRGSSPPGDRNDAV